MTNLQKNTLEKIKETLAQRTEEIELNHLEKSDYWWVELTLKNQVEIKANTKTIEALQREGHIKWIEHKECCFGNLDIVEVVKGGPSNGTN